VAANHYTPNGGKNSSNQGWQYQDQNSGRQQRPEQGGSQPPRKPGFNLGEWIPIFILFVLPFGITQFIAFFWALSKVINMIKRNKEYQEQLRRFGRSAANVTRDVSEAVRREAQRARQASGAAKSTANADASAGAARSSAQPKSSASAGGYTYAGTGRPAPAKKGKKVRGGTALVVLGIIFAASLGFSTLMCLVSFEPVGAFVLALLTLGALAMLGGGIGLNRRKERYLNYLAYIGANREINLAHMAASFGVSVKRLCKDLRKMLAKRILPTGYLDLAAGKLFLTEMGYQAPAAQPEAAPEPAAEEKADDEILREIRQINDAIPDEVMSAKIDRIEEITGKILAYQKSRPERSSQLRSFLNYYLPTTLKILRAYAQLDAQGIEGENISAAKARIEGMMDQVVAGFEKQLDKLFQDDAMDISSDVQVLENMLKKDGLSDDQQNMTMTL